jgi:glucoamylase
LRKYNGQDGIGWEDDLNGLTNLASMRSQTGDHGKLLNVSAMVLKALDDKSYAGALIASLSTPFGE